MILMQFVLFGWHSKLAIPRLVMLQETPHETYQCCGRATVWLCAGALGVIAVSIHPIRRDTPAEIQQEEFL